MKHNLLKIIFISSFLINLCAADCPRTKKHIIVILADDLGWNDISLHGSNQYLTSNIDALAYKSLILHNYYTFQLCSPSRSALMSGINPVRTGMHYIAIPAGHPYGFPLNIKILPQYLKELGYRTHAVGKWHLGFHRAAYTPTKRGFDSHFGYWTEKEDYFTHCLNKLDLIKGYDLRNNLNATYNYTNQYATDIFTDKAVNIINSHPESEPLFLYLAHLAVHSGNRDAPLQAPQHIIDKFNHIKNSKRRTYAAMVWKLDQSVGRVIGALSKKNLLKDSIIVFINDNGGPAAGFDRNAASNWPLRGVKDTTWEGGIRANSFIWSSDLPQSSINHYTMHVQDWLPTILGALNCTPQNNTYALDGRNMWPVLKGEMIPQQEEFVIQNDPIRKFSGLRKGPWKLIQGGTFSASYDKWFGPSGRSNATHYNITMIQQSETAHAFQNQNISFPNSYTIASLRHNLTLACKPCSVNFTNCIPCNPHKQACLFNIRRDPCERHNLAEKFPQIVENMKTLIKTKYKSAPLLYKPFDLRSLPKYWNNTWTYWMDLIDPHHSSKL